VLTAVRDHFSCLADSGVLRLPAPLPLDAGGVLDGCEVAFSAYGDPTAPAVVVLGGISAGRHVVAHADDPRPGWWPHLVGPRLAVDTDELRVLGIDFVGGTGASSSPTRWSRQAPFPTISTRDQARAIAGLLDQMAINRIHAAIGSSYGGMVALAFASLFPDRVDRLVVISAAHESHPMATALRGLQRRIVRLGLSTGEVDNALGIARGIAMTAYRTPDEFALRFGNDPSRTPDGLRFPVDEYLEHCGRAFSAEFSADAFLCLSESIDLHRIDPATVNVPATLVAVDTDSLVPSWQMRALHAALEDSTLLEISSIYGHDAFLKEPDAITRIVRDALNPEEIEQ
jgi:homoserine O-acetyltransferase